MHLLRAYCPVCLFISNATLAPRQQQVENSGVLRAHCGLATTLALNELTRFTAHIVAHWMSRLRGILLLRMIEGRNLLPRPPWFLAMGQERPVCCVDSS